MAGTTRRGPSSGAAWNGPPRGRGRSRAGRPGSAPLPGSRYDSSCGARAAPGQETTTRRPGPTAGAERRIAISAQQASGRLGAADADMEACSQHGRTKT